MLASWNGSCCVHFDRGWRACILKPVCGSRQVRDKDVPITFDNPALEELFDKLKQMKAFNDWCNGIDEDFVVKGITVQSIDMFGPRVGFVKFKADVTDKNDIAIPSIVFMRGPCVGIFVLITCEEDKKQYTVLTAQPRVPTGRYALLELPAGMLDDSGDFVGVAAKELREETGLEVHQKDLYDLTEKAFGSQYPGIYPSAGGCDEYFRLFLYRAKLPR